MPAGLSPPSVSSGTPPPVTTGGGVRIPYGAEAQLTKYVGLGSLYVRSTYPPSRSLYWSPKPATIS